MHAVPIPWLLCPYPPWPPWPPEAMALTTPCMSVTGITSSRTHQEEEQEDLHLPATELMSDRGGSLRWGAYIGLTPCIAPSYHHTGHYHTGHYHTTPRRFCSVSSYAPEVQAPGLPPTTVTPVRAKCTDRRGGQTPFLQLTVSSSSQSKSSN